MAHKFPNVAKLIKPYRIEHGSKFRMDDYDPADTQGLDLKSETDELLKQSVERMSEMQQKLYAQDRWAVLLILQSMDAAGKDSVIRHVMSGVNPEGCEVRSFKQPSTEELNHDFLWRAFRALPERGRIGVFNRSYYEEVLIVRVHQNLLDNEHLPDSLVTKKIWKERFEDIAAFEKYLTRNGTLLRKVFLNVSRTEQKQRFLDRLDDADKNWKFSEDDVHERDHWDEYMDAYTDMIRHTAAPHAPWFVVPADHKWFTRLTVASILIEALASLQLAYPRVDSGKQKELRSARKLLMKQK